MTDAEVRASGRTDVEALEEVLAEVTRDTAASVGALYLTDPDEDVLWLALVSGGTSHLLDPWVRVPLDSPFPVAQALRENTMVWVPDQQDMARRYPVLGMVMPYDAMLAAVPVHGEEAWGVLALLLPTNDEGALGPEEAQALRAGCRRAARVLDERRASGAAPVRAGDRPRVVTPLPREDPPAPFVARAAYDLVQRLPIGFCTLDRDGRVTYVNPTAEQMLEIDADAVLGQRPQAVLPWLGDPVFESHYRAAVVTRRTVGFTRPSPEGHSLAFMLFAHENGVGIRITDAGVNQALSDVMPVRHPRASDIQPAALYHLTHVAALLAEATSTLDIVRLVREQVTPAFGPDSFVLAQASEGRLTVLGSGGLDEARDALHEGMPQAVVGPAAEALADHRQRFHTALEEPAERTPSSRPARDPMTAWAVLPLITDSREVGCLVLGYRELRPFPVAERTLLTSLAGVIGLALDRTLTTDTEHRLALDLQSVLLPRRLPVVPGLALAARYLPTTRGSGVGGDFYDVIHQEDDVGAAVAVGDVQGHDTEAAALMGQVRTAVRAIAGAPPGEVLGRTNRLLLTLDAERFTSCLYAHIDPVAHQVRLANAGHVPPLLRRPDGRTGAVDVPPGLVLGIDGGFAYSTTTLDFPAGSVLALYTDGLVEKPDTMIDDSVGDLARTLAEADVTDLDAAAETLLRHAYDSGPRYDDIALLLIRAEDRPTARPGAAGVRRTP
ncbi:SpoIIE family protein phosphatase [Streptomyces fragilis]|uniref:SpoIIE family protein phosphatase n=1 Tax=Streptomyces fragilis TaxID=67301 RepID=A0ABV2YHY8_9ACTN|nr:SpoIIE family protein phosphatase [Streptomyces fragilis]